MSLCLCILDTVPIYVCLAFTPVLGRTPSVSNIAVELCPCYDHCGFAVSTVFPPHICVARISFLKHNMSPAVLHHSILDCEAPRLANSCRWLHEPSASLPACRQAQHRTFTMADIFVVA